MGVNLEDCIRIQEKLSKRVILEDRIPDKIETVGGVDQAFLQDNRIISCITILDYPEMNLIEKKIAIKRVNFPYIPGFLAFREFPAILEACRKLTKYPDILIIDGHGIAHPRRIGIATHAGILLNRVTIGVAKKKLVGEFSYPEEVGQYKPLIYGNSTIGFVMKSREYCNPIFISPGHKISLETGLEIVKNCIRGHKLPEPVWQAHRLVNEFRRKVIILSSQ